MESQQVANVKSGNGGQGKTQAGTPMERARQRLHAASVPGPQGYY
jgi:hypothetical protein